MNSYTIRIPSANTVYHIPTRDWYTVFVDNYSPFMCHICPGKIIVTDTITEQSVLVLRPNERGMLQIDREQYLTLFTVGNGTSNTDNYIKLTGVRDQEVLDVRTSNVSINVTNLQDPHPVIANNLLNPHPVIANNLLNPHPIIANNLLNPHPIIANNLLNPHPVIANNLLNPHPVRILHSALPLFGGGTTLTGTSVFVYLNTSWTGNVGKFLFISLAGTPTSEHAIELWLTNPPATVWHFMGWVNAQTQYIGFLLNFDIEINWRVYLSRPAASGSFIVRAIVSNTTKYADF